MMLVFACPLDITPSLLVQARIINTGDVLALLRSFPLIPVTRVAVPHIYL